MPPKKRSNKKGGKKKEKAQKIDIKKPWDEQNAEEKSNTVTILKSTFADLELKNVDVVVATETQYPAAFAADHIAVVGSCTEAQGAKLNKFSNLMDVVDKFEVCVSDVGVGSKLPFLVTAFDAEMKETTILEDRRGKITFIQFWAPFSGRCVEAVEKMMALNEKRGKDWEGKVCLLTLGCETSMEKITEKLKAKDWMGDSKGSKGLVQHLWAGESDEEDEDGVVVKYEIETLPECMVVDGEGRLLKRGDPEEFDFELVIDKLLKGDTDLSNVQKPPEAGSWQSLTDGKRKELTDKVVEKLKADDDLKDLIMVCSQADIHPVMQGKAHTELDVMFVGKVDVRHESKVAPIIDILSKDGGVKDVEQAIMVSAPETEVTPADACSECKVAFSTMDKKTLVRWHCSMCVTPYTLCLGCEEKHAAKKGKPVQAGDHPRCHPLFRMGPGVAKEDLEKAEFKIGSFAVAMNDTEDDKTDKAGCCGGDEEKAAKAGCCGGGDSGVIHEDVFCNACKEGPIAEGPRWKCCSCPDFDLCDACFHKCLESNEGGKTKFKGKKGKDNVKHQKNHFFVRIEDSSLVKIVGDDEDEGDEGDFDEGDFDNEDMALLAKAMAGEDGGELDPTDTEGILAKIRALQASGALDEDDDDDEDAGATGKISEILPGDADYKSKTDEATQVPLPDDDDF